MDYSTIIESNKKAFQDIANTTIIRAGIESLMAYLDTTDFYYAPNSTRFHGCYPGGLCQHSLNVYRELKSIIKVYPCPAVDEDSIALVSLFHDLCKVNTYKNKPRWRKDAHNQWEQYPCYEFEEDFAYGGHGSKSVYLLSKFVKLTDLEAVAINCHMSTWEDGKANAIGAAFRQNSFAWLLHVADEAATFIVEPGQDVDRVP